METGEKNKERLIGKVFNLWIKENTNIVNWKEEELGKNKGKNRNYWNRKQRSIQ